jgi:hypothetical protein
MQAWSDQLFADKGRRMTDVEQFEGKRWDRVGDDVGEHVGLVVLGFVMVAKLAREYESKVVALHSGEDPDRDANKRKIKLAKGSSLMLYTLV